MRRLLLALAAVALLAPPADAAPAQGEIVLVANGPSGGTVTLPADVTLDVESAKVQTRAGYLVLAVAQRGSFTGGLFWAPGFGERRLGLKQVNVLKRGRSDVRVLASGATTVTIPATGVRGRKVYRLGTRLRDAVATVANVPVTARAYARHVLPFRVARPSITMHGWAATPLVAGGSAWRLCLAETADDTGCVASRPNTALATYAAAEIFYPEDHLSGARHGQLSAAQVLYDEAPVVHYVLVLPTA